MRKDTLQTGIRKAQVFKEFVFASCILWSLLAVSFYDIFFLGKTLTVSNTIPATLPNGHFNYPGELLENIPVYDVTPAVFEEPYQRFKEKAIARGIFPLWNPYQAAGHPFLATFQSSLLYFPEVILYALPSPYDWDIYLLFRLFVAGVSSYGFMRVLGFRSLASYTTAVAFMLSGPILSRVPNVFLNVDILIPALLLLTELVLRYNLKRYILLLSLVIFQVIVGGHPDHAFFALFTWFVYFLSRIYGKAYSYELKHVIKNMVVSFTCGMGLSSVLLFPFAEYVFWNAWHTHIPDIGGGLRSLKDTITIIFPWYYASGLVSGDDWSPHTWPGGWIGFLPLWLTSFAILAKNKNKSSYVFIFLLGFYLLKIYNVYVIEWIGYLPFFNLVRFPLHSTPNLAFAVAVLSGIAISYIEGNLHNQKRFFFSVGPIALISLVFVWVYPPANKPVVIFGLAGVMFAVLLISGLMCLNGKINQKAYAWCIVVTLFSELVLLIPRERITRFEAFQVPPYIEYLRKDNGSFRVYGIGGSLYPNTATAFGLEDIGIYEGLFVKRFANYIRELVDDRMFNDESFQAFRNSVRDPSSRFLDLLNVKYLIMPRETRVALDQMSQLSLQLVYDKEVKIYERLNAYSRVMIRHLADVNTDNEETLKILKTNYNLNRRVMLNRVPTGVDLDPNLPSQDASTVKAIHYNINHKSFLVKMKHDGILVINDVYYPGWNVKVNGVRSDVLIANYLFQAVVLPAGEHLVEFEFRPLSFQIGMLASLLSLVFLIVFVLRGRAKRDHEKRKVFRAE